ncbi:Uncharacterized protein FWK35_00039132, partial [Aphis craccivora]
VLQDSCCKTKTNIRLTRTRLNQYRSCKTKTKIRPSLHDSCCLANFSFPRKH